MGVSPDTPEKNARFKEKYEFPYRLLSDTEQVLAQAYGAWVEKKNDGRTYQGIDRTTVLVDAEGVVRELWRSVKVAGHVDAVLAASQAL